jgi:hypothetical protein
VADYTQHRPGIQQPPFQKYLYGSIESGYPAIICFGTSTQNYHAIPIFGHTFNEDTWVPSAESSYFRIGAGTAYIPSESWLNTYLAHDDNWGSNYCIPRDFLYSQRTCDNWPTGSKACGMQSECVAYIIATLPKAVQTNPLTAEIIGADFLFSIMPNLQQMGEQWESRLASYAAAHRLVLRTVLIDSRDYGKHLGEITDWEGNTIQKRLIEGLKDFQGEKIWMVELSVPELFSANRRKVGEVLLRAEQNVSNVRDFSSFILARLPGCFALYTGGGAQNPEYRLIPTAVKSHVQLFGCEDL